MDLFAHAIAESGINHLVLTHPRFPPEQLAHHDGFEMVAVTLDLDVLAVESLLDVLLDQNWIHGF